MRRLLFVALVLAAVAALSCGIIAFESRPAELVFGSADTSPFGGAQLSQVVVEAGARLDIVPGFVDLPRLPRPLVSAGAVGVGSRMLVVGGAGALPGYSNCSNGVLAWDPGASGFAASDTFAVVNQGLQLFAHPDGNAYALMGYCNTSSTDEGHVYRLLPQAPTPQLVGSMPVPAYYFAGGVIPDGSGTPLLVTASGYGCGPLNGVIQSMNPATGATVRYATTLSPRCMASAAAQGATLYVFGGNTDVGCSLPATASANALLDEIVAVRLSPEEAPVVAHLPEPMASACAVARTDGTIALFGGVRYPPATTGGVAQLVSDDVLIFDPKGAQVSVSAAKLPAPRANASCAQVGPKQIAVLGGAGTDLNATDTAWVFEPYAAQGIVLGQPFEGTATVWKLESIDADVPASTSIRVELRAAADSAGLAAASWTPVAMGGEVSGGKWIQWRATLESATRVATPVLRGVTLQGQ